MEVAIQYKDFDPMEFIDGKNKIIVQTESQIKTLGIKLANAKYFVWDVETSGLYGWNTLQRLKKSEVKQHINNGTIDEFVPLGDNYYRKIPGARICGHAIRVEKFSYYIPVEHEITGDTFHNVSDQLVEEYILPHFNREDVIIVNHNIKFDLHMLRFHYNFVPKGKVRDTMVLAHLCNENSWERDKKGRPIFKLKVLGKRFYGDDADDQEQFLKDYMKKHNLQRYSQVPIDILGPYAIRDVDLTDFVYLGVLEELEEEWEGDTVGFPLERLIEDDMKFLRILEEMYSGGIHIDRKKTERYYREAIEEMEACKQRAFELMGVEINLGSPKQTTKYCKTENAQEKTLTNLIKADPESKEAKLAQIILEYKSWEKVKGTYYEKYLMLADEQDMIHPEMFQVATVTSRLASREPNFQALPRPNDSSELMMRIYKVRDVVTPPGKDYIHLYADYSQIEMNLATIYAEDEAMADAIISGVDIHTRAAENAFGADTVYDEAGNIIKRYRAMAKSINFGTIYGMGAFSFSLNMANQGINLTRQEASEILEKWHAAYTGFRRFYLIAQTVAKLTGQIRLWTGRRRRFIDPDTGFLYPKTEFRKAMNNIIQGAVAEMVKQAAIRIDTILKSETASGKSRLVNFIHDDINMYIHKEDFHLIPAIKKAMEDFPVFTKSGIPIRVDVEYANYLNSWGSTEDWTPEKTVQEVFAIPEGEEIPEVKPIPIFTWHLPVEGYKPTIFKSKNTAPVEEEVNRCVAMFSGVNVSRTKFGDPYIRFEFVRVDNPYNFGQSISHNIFLSGKRLEEYVREFDLILNTLDIPLHEISTNGTILLNSHNCAINSDKYKKFVTVNYKSSISKGKKYLNLSGIGKYEGAEDFHKLIPSPLKIA